MSARRLTVTMEPGPPEKLDPDVAAAIAGDRAALERVVRGAQPLVARLALRFFGCPDHAADATQDVLVQLATKLDRFDGRSAFSTWVYRVATNKFLSLARSPAERAVTSLEAFDADLAEPIDAHHDPDHALALAEIRIGCTLAMLLCLDREARLAYILGAIAELDHEVAADILGCTAVTYRKRLSRARAAITGLMQRRCGVFDPGNACQCAGRVNRATRRGHLAPGRWLFATSSEQAERFPEVLVQIRQLEDVRRAAAIYQSHPDPRTRGDIAERLDQLAELRAAAG